MEIDASTQTQVSNKGFFDITNLRDTIREHALADIESKQHIGTKKQQNFSTLLREITPDQKSWWFGDQNISTIADLESLVVKSHNIKQWPASQDMLGKGEMLMTSSGSTGEKKVICCDLEHWFRYITGCSRQLFAADVNENDRVLSTDPGMMQSGYRALEDAARYAVGAQVVIDRSSSLRRKLELIDEFEITVLISNPAKLQRMAAMDPSRFFKHKLKAIISTGMPLDNVEIIQNAFKIDKLYDVFGSLEISQIYFTCQHGHRHVNDDLLHVINKQGKSFYSNVWSLPVFNLDSGDYLEYSYKGQCGCGSHLPTVDRFIPKSYLGVDKQ